MIFQRPLIDYRRLTQAVLYPNQPTQEQIEQVKVAFDGLVARTEEVGYYERFLGFHDPIKVQVRILGFRFEPGHFRTTEEITREVRYSEDITPERVLVAEDTAIQRLRTALIPGVKITISNLISVALSFGNPKH